MSLAEVEEPRRRERRGRARVAQHGADDADGARRDERDRDQARLARGGGEGGRREGGVFRRRVPPAARPAIDAQAKESVGASCGQNVCAGL